MKVATKANVRTANAARTGLNPALNVAFRGGSVMGMGVVDSECWTFIALHFLQRPRLGDWKTISVYGFSFGASSIALFARVGGGIYTSADVGASGGQGGGHPGGSSAEPSDHRR